MHDTGGTLPIATGWSDSCRAGFAPAGDRRLSTAPSKVGYVALIRLIAEEADLPVQLDIHDCCGGDLLSIVESAVRTHNSRRARRGSCVTRSIFLDADRRGHQPEGCARAGPEIRKGNVHWLAAQAWPGVHDAPDAELKEVDRFPYHRHLEHAVKFVQRHGVRHKNAPPNHGADPKQPDLQLQKNRSSLRRGPGIRHATRSQVALHNASGGLTPEILVVPMEDLNRRGAEAVIPSRRNRTESRKHERKIRGSWCQVEKFLSKTKKFRAVATRCDRTDESFAARIHLLAGVSAAARLSTDPGIREVFPAWDKVRSLERIFRPIGRDGHACASSAWA